MKTNEVVIDTNLLVRYLTEDDGEKAKAVGNLLALANKGKIKILVASIVIAELVWVLESFYKMNNAEITVLVEAIIDTPGVVVSDKINIRRALEMYKKEKIDFIDAWIISFARDKGAKTIYTFDKKHFKNIKGTKISTP